MALSNWDTWAKDFDNKTVLGIFETKQVKVEIYKNWLYVTVGDVLMTMHEGEISINDIYIRATRGPQSGVYVFCKAGYKHNNNLKGMIGCGVYGYEDEEFVGVTQKCIEFFKKKVEIWEEEYCIGVPENFTFDGKRYNQGDAYFAKKLHADVGKNDNSEINVVSTKVGEQEDTIMTKFFNNMDKVVE